MLFGVTGDLAHKMTSSALYAMVECGTLTVPVVGVASTQWTLAQLRERATESLQASGTVVNKKTLSRLLSLLRYVPGDYTDAKTFQALKEALGSARRPAHYLAIPPSLFETVILSDGDAVLQPRKIQRSGLWAAVEGRVLITIHNEQMLDVVAERHPARHYVQLPITPLRQPNGELLRLEIALPGYSVWLRAWQVQVGRVKLYLLDSNDAANYPAHRGGEPRRRDTVGQDDAGSFGRSGDLRGPEGEQAR